MPARTYDKNKTNELINLLWDLEKVILFKGYKDFWALQKEIINKAYDLIKAGADPHAKHDRSKHALIDLIFSEAIIDEDYFDLIKELVTKYDLDLNRTYFYKNGGVKEIRPSALERAANFFNSSSVNKELTFFLLELGARNPEGIKTLKASLLTPDDKARYETIMTTSNEKKAQCDLSQLSFLKKAPVSPISDEQKIKNDLAVKFN